MDELDVGISPQNDWSTGTTDNDWSTGTTDYDVPTSLEHRVLAPATFGWRDQQPVPHPSTPDRGRGLDQYDLALLAGDADRVSTVALVALDHAGVIECGEKLVLQLVEAGSITLESLRQTKPVIFPWGLDIDFVVRPLEPLPPRAHPVEHAVYDAVVTTAVASNNVVAIRRAAASSSAMTMVRDRLVALELIWSEAQSEARTRRRRLVAAIIGVTTAFLAMGLALGLGNWWGLAAVAAAPVLALCAEMLQPKRTGLGRRVLRGAQEAHPRPTVGQNHPSTASPADLSVLLALYGPRLLWESDPALAFALGVSHPSDSTGCAGCGGGGGGCGGCGGCGGGCGG